MEIVRAHLRIYGRVQGVGFRWSMQREAKKLGVNGWVRNLPNGSVEAVIEGERERVEALIGWAHQGPSWARVTRVEVGWETPKGEKGFRVVG
ncbi:MULTISPECIES: acylphosphatase [Thermococcus]|uniref:Acylphosphatase n=2 Tax=Thermococcus sibiricus TaxID=172049 RepID=C6A3M2_THESM|nr:MULTISPECIES: acylphosphatase [Thermococcus]KUK29230.1 MAG: Acylphosphatase [Thermococcus sp. 40_45]HII68083.1 acylphosphatase [Thermococcaceae archaeon]ACS90217.1 Acylphosphatase [Thermococcus sibiricus MM 739]KUK18188.1 MAG: Acylphosphatase [Thermococcus sibiricus]MBC7095250.1 acylphosphatase [Thermococcus sp.]